MKVLRYGATGMVGRAIGRSKSAVAHPKLREMVHSDLMDWHSIEGDCYEFRRCYDYP